MSRRFEQLDERDTPMGTISLRRRLDPTLKVDVYEVKLGDEFLMSSLFTVAEEELAHLGLAAVAGGELDVVVGGLGLGCTARAALTDPRVRTLTVVDALAEVIDWHHRGLVPHAAELTGDPRVRLLHGDFFALVRAGGLGPADAILLDVDHSPRHVLHPSHAGLYTADGLRGLAGLLRPGGVFALWADGAPDEEFTGVLRRVFATATAHTVRFPNPLLRTESASTVYVAATPVLRPGTAGDAPAVAVIWRDGWRDGHLGHVPDDLLRGRTPESFDRRAAERVADTTVATVEGAVAGFVMIAGDEVEQVYVAAAHRGTGVAAALLAAAERLVADGGHRRAWLAVVAGNGRARRFYERHGWADDGPFDNVVTTDIGVVRVPCRRYVKDVTARGPSG
ncbi:MAG TPA: GNAT family N-acetyltransferase [Pseudonocardiaceae bacterium]